MCGVVRKEGDVPGTHPRRLGLARHVYPGIAMAQQMEGRGIAAAGRGHMPCVAQLAYVIDFRAQMDAPQKIIQRLLKSMWIHIHICQISIGRPWKKTGAIDKECCRKKNCAGANRDRKPEVRVIHHKGQ